MCIYIYHNAKYMACILAGQPTIVTITSGAKPQCKPLALGTFEPTLQGSYVIYTIHGFTAGAFTPPSGEQGRLRRTNSQCGRTLAGGLYCLFGFGNFVQSFKGPSINAQARKTRSIYARKAHYHAASCLCYKRNHIYPRFHLIQRPPASSR